MNERLEAEEPGHAQGCGLPSILTAEDVVKTDCFRVRLAMPGANSSILDQTKSLIQQDNTPGAGVGGIRRGRKYACGSILRRLAEREPNAGSTVRLCEECVGNRGSVDFTLITLGTGWQSSANGDKAGACQFAIGADIHQHLPSQFWGVRLWAERPFSANFVLRWPSVIGKYMTIISISITNAEQSCQFNDKHC